ncbi:MAG TPA: methyltransferase domain-containing protein [Gemmataceae bacterium]
MNAQPDWWRTFFSGLAVEFWLLATPEEMTKSEVDFVQKVSGVVAPGKLLDVPCGGGRHSVVFAERGYSITAVDLSPVFLEHARIDAAQRKVKIRWEEREMSDLPWDREFDGAFCLGNSFGYQSDEGNAAFLKAVARTLKPGGKFVIDTGYIAETLLPNLQLKSWAQIGDIYFLPDRHFDPASGRLEVEYTFIRDGRIEKKAMSARIYTYREFSRLMEEAGFIDLQGYGSLDQAPFRFGANRLLMEATKP